MRRIILIKHAMPEINAAEPSASWRLGEQGRCDAATLADRLAPHEPAQVVASVEPKAAETAQIVAERLGLPWETLAGLHEHERSSVDWQERAAFEAAVAGLFTHPDALVFGDETASQALERFSAALAATLARHQQGNLAIVTHGTVITLFVARYNPIEPLAFWRQLGLGDFVVVGEPGFGLLEG